MTSEAIVRDGSSKETDVNGQSSRIPSREQEPSATGTKKEDGEKAKEKPPSKLKKAWTAAGLDVPTLLVMGKAAIPPTIAISMYQADAVANYYTTLGYLVAIISVIGLCIMPRAKFIQNILLEILAVCVGSATVLLMTWTGVKARQHTTNPNAPPQRYNSSQSAVLGVWLFFQAYFVNAAKAKLPQLQIPAIMYAILVNIAATNGFQFTTTAQCERFVMKLLISFLSGLGLAAGVSFLIMPTTSRFVVTKQMTGFMMALRGALGAHKTYLFSLEDHNVFSKTLTVNDDERKKEDKKHSDKKPKPKTRPEVAAIQEKLAVLQRLHAALTADLRFAKREFAYGKMTAGEFETVYKYLRLLLLPTIGLSSVMDIFERTAEMNHWDGDVDEEDVHSRDISVHEWNEMFRFLHGPLEHIFQALDDGLAHVLLRLQFGKPPQKKKGQDQSDAEAKGDLVKPGDQEFAKHFKQQTETFLGCKELALRHWAGIKGVELPHDYFTNSDSSDEESLTRVSSITTRKIDQRQLYVMLYVIFLLNSISRTLMSFVEFADEHDQAVAKSKFIKPGAKRLRKWLSSVFSKQDAGRGDETTVHEDSVLYMGEAYNSKKDPERLPPTNTWQKFGNGVRGIAHFFRSPESSFGLRAAVATMTVGIIAFLHDTQQFFVENRLVWAMIMIAISMSPTAGQTLFQFILRVSGTAGAMIFAWLAWYIPAEHTAGIIVFMYIFVALGFYILVKRPEFTIAGMITAVSTVLIVGYELQVRKIGVAVSESTGQPAYPIYQLGPYRLAAVSGGLAVAYFWTIFPYPITEHSALRQKLGSALYLSANYYSIIHEQVVSRVQGTAGDEENDKQAPGYALRKARDKVFAKQMLAIQSLRQHAGFVKWEFSLGGKFPLQEYEAIIGYVNNITNYTSLLGYASQVFKDPTLFPASSSPSSSSSSPSSPSTSILASSQWHNDFRRLITSTNVTSHEITSLLSLLSSSIQNGQPLPPYLQLPQDHHLSKKLQVVDSEVLSLRHIAEPGYAAFAVMAISTRCVHMDIEKLAKAVKKLVGELDFSFHVVSTSTASAGSSAETLVRDSRREEARGVKQD